MVSCPAKGFISISLLIGSSITKTHFKDNWDNDRVPSMNISAEQTHSSHARLARIVAEKKAALWINHDLPTFDNLKHSPDFYE
jgi:N-acyl homoserine lactone hydrolase